MSEATHIGRFIYIDPNNMNADSISNGIPQPYEDYCISVNLEVKIPSRFACGTECINDDSSSKTIYFSSDNGTISFFGGSGAGKDENGEYQQGFLTTNYTDISSSDMAHGNKETLGIESINISYDSWMYPIITIKFIDLRGSALFMPQEQAYYNAISSDSKDITQMSSGSFFKALFSFPQPLFKLTVKGFYGRPVVYNLAVLDFKAEFNAENGNFECTTQFKGYMYGVYTDIPMTYLAVAPYMTSDNGEYMGYWNYRKFSFKDLDGTETPMMTFPEMRDTISSANANLEQVTAESPEYKSNQELADKKSSLQSILLQWNKICSNNRSDVFDKFVAVRPLIDNNGNASSVNKILYYRLIPTNGSTEEINNASNALLNICEAVKEYDEHFTTTTTLQRALGCVSGSNTGVKVLLDNFAPAYTFTKNSGNVIEKNRKANTTVFTEYEQYYDFIYGEVVNAFNSLPDNSERGLYIFVLTSKFDEYLNTIIQDYEAKNLAYDQELNKLKINNLTRLLKFSPTIQNLMEMTFAHMETFVHEYYTMLDNINRQIESGKRTIESMGLSDLPKQSDLKHGMKQVPPFPLFVKNSNDHGIIKDEVVLPEKFFQANKDMEEMKFVRKLLNAAKLYNDKQLEVSKTLEQISTNSVGTAPSSSVENFIPITPYDMSHNDGTWNPYNYVNFIMGNSTKDIINQIVLTFVLRAYYYFLVNEDGRRKDKYQSYFGRVEAINLKKGVASLNREIATELSKIDLPLEYLRINPSSYDIFDGEDKFECRLPLVGLRKNEGSGSWKRVKYQWIQESTDNYILPVGEYDRNTIKDELANGEYQNNGKYLRIKDGEIVGIGTEGFNIFNDPNYLETLKDNILLSDSETEDIGEQRIEKINKQFINITDSSKFNGKDSPCYRVVGGNQAKREIFGLNGKGVEWSDAIKDLNSVQFMDADGTLCGVNFDKSERKSIFEDKDKSFIGKQETHEAKAYIFLMSVGLNAGFNKFGSNKQYNVYPNGTIMKLMLLREGAYYWRKDLMERNNGKDPIKVSEEIIPAESNELYLDSSSYSLLFKYKGDNRSSYFKIPDNVGNVTESRRVKVLEYFSNWVNAEFVTLCQELEDGYSNGGSHVKGATIDKMKTLYASVVTILDDTAVIDLKNNWIDPSNAGLTIINSAFKNFQKTLMDLMPEQTVETITNGDVGNDDSSIQNDYDLQLSCYLTLKSLYDRWFCGKDRRTWYLPREGETNTISDFGHIKYLDSFYNDIGRRLIIDITNVSSIMETYVPSSDSINELVGPTYSIKSMYEYMSDLCQRNSMVFIAMPLLYGFNISDGEKIGELFDAKPYSRIKSSDLDGQSYVCLYTYKPSEHLDLSGTVEDGYCYANDSFDIADITGKASSLLPSSVSEDVLDNNGSRIPAFGVTYGMQSQSYFKRISISMNNPQITEASLAMTQTIASKGSQGARESVLYGQDLYRIYSNYSYTCDVEMMGDAQIMPLMCFQLNNIPMFRGAYIITKVEHNIVVGEMTTHFTGVRLNKNAIPLTTGTMILLDADGQPVTFGEEYIEDGPSVVIYDVPKGDIPSGSFNVDDAIRKMYSDCVADSKERGPVHIKTPMTLTKSTGLCLGAVRNFLNAGGISGNFGGSAINSVPYLENNGFSMIAELSVPETARGESIQNQRLALNELSKNGDGKQWKGCKGGDIAVMEHGQYGHICMYNDLDKVWVSDFNQANGPWPYNSQKPGKISIFRYRGNIVRSPNLKV